VRKSQVRFWSGGGVGDRPADHSAADLLIETRFEGGIVFEAFWFKFGHTAKAAGG